MQTFKLKKLNSISILMTNSRLVKINTSIKINISNKNFTFIKNVTKKFCENNIIKDVHQNTNKKEEFTINLEDLDSLKTIKHVTLKIYSSENSEIIKKEDNLPIKLQKVGNEEVEFFVPDKSLTKAENFANYRKFLNRKESHEKQYNYHRMKVGIALFIFFVGLFSLWIPLYKTICESQGFAVKTTHTDYKFSGKKCTILIYSSECDEEIYS